MQGNLSFGGTLVAAATAPTVTASTATSVGSTTATLNGNVTSDGGATITDRGFVYKIGSGVAITDNKTAVAGTTNAYSLNVSSLAPSTTYSFKAYASNSAGLTLSAEQSFTTSASPVPKILVTLPGQSSPNSGTPTAQTAGTPFNVTVTATTDGTMTDTTYSGSKSITFSGPGGSPSYPGTVSFSSGVGTASVTLTLAQTAALTATDGTIGGLASSSFTVNPGAINSYTVSASSPQTATTPFNVTVTARDANNNTVTTDSTTQVTMTSSGSVSFTPNPATLSGGSTTVSATAAAGGSVTLTATDANLKTGTSPSITVNTLPRYRSKTTGNWSSPATWDVSTDDGNSWAGAGASPTSADGLISIRNGHEVSVTAAVTVDQVTVENGGTLIVTNALTVSNGAGDDIVVQNGGVLSLNLVNGAPTWNSGATAKIESGGTLRVGNTGMTTSGAGVNAANFVYANGAILEYAITSSFSSSSVTYFPGVDATTVPVFRVTALTSGVGAGSATVFNGVFDIGSGVAFTWSGAGVKVFRNGIRGTGTMTQSTAGLFLINGATGELGGGTVTLGAAGLFITNGSVVTMTSDKTFDGTGSLTNSGTLSLGQRVLTLSKSPVLNGTLATAIDRNGGTSLAGKLSVTSGTFALGGTLTVTNVGAALTGGEVFDIADAPAFSGAFAATNLPTLGAGLNWWAGNLAVNGTLRVNRVPFATNDSASVAQGQLLVIPVAKLLANDSDADGDTLSVTSVSGATLNGSNVEFTAPLSGSSASFTYTVSDGRDGSATGTVNIALTAGNSSGFNQLAAPVNLGGNAWQLSYLGIPGTNYALDWRTNLVLGNWVPVVTNAAGPNGQLLFTNSSIESQNYYRTRYVP